MYVILKTLVRKTSFMNANANVNIITRMIPDSDIVIISKMPMRKCVCTETKLVQKIEPYETSQVKRTDEKQIIPVTT